MVFIIIHYSRELTNPALLSGDDDGAEDSEEEEDIGEEGEESEKRDSGYGSQGQIKKPVSGRVIKSLLIHAV